MKDYSHYELEAQRYLAKANSYLVTAQSIGNHAAGVAMINADVALSHAISELVAMREAIREKQRHVGAF